MQFLPEEIFLSKSLSRFLLFGHLFTLTVFGWFKWCKEEGGPIKIFFRSFGRNEKSKINPSRKFLFFKFD